MESRQGSIPSDIFKQHQQKQGLFVDFKGMVFKKSPVLHTVEVATCLQDDNQQKDFQFYNQASMCSCLSSTTKPSEPIQPGTPLAAYSEGVCDVSAGHISHPSTTHSATEVVFAYLQQGVEGQVSMANAELRASLA